MKPQRFTLVFVLLCAASAQAQNLPSYDLGGASKPKPDLSFRKENQYKRVHQASLRFILRGELDKTEAFLNDFREAHPEDAETPYMLGILHGQRGNLTKAEDFLTQAVAAGLPDNRIVAGPREMMKPLEATEFYQRLLAKYKRELVHGPLVGNVTADTASFWVRTGMEANVEVVLRDAAGNEVARSETVRSNREEDYTAVAAVGGLRPNTEYFYAVLLDGAACSVGPTQKFRTFGPRGAPSNFVIAFGGGAGYVPENERMWKTIGGFDPHAILLLGDNVYIDDPESVAMQQYTYQRRQSRPEWRQLTARSPVFTIWDDHDFSTNDSWGGALIDKPFWKKEWVFPIYRQNWANPGYGGGDEHPGCYYAFQIGDVDFIMLDCRYYRTSPRAEPKTMLGPVQKAWLKKQLRQATGTFKVICSSVPWDFRTKGDSLDTWNGYQQEHEELLGFLESEQIEGVILMSADRHRSDCWKIARPNGYDLYEFNSSRLTNQHVHPTMEKRGAIFSYNKLQSFGLVTFDTTIADPQVTYEVVTINGDKPHWITVKRSALSAK